MISDKATTSAMHLVDPELREGLKSFPDIQLDQAQLSLFRGLAAGSGECLELPDLIEDRLVVEVAGGEVGLIVCRPRSRELLPAVCCLHGGGLVAGTAQAMAAQRRGTAIDLNAVLVFVDYRLAPEHPFPAPLEDCYAALRWMFTQGAAHGIDVNRIAVSGISAGGGLAAALSILTRDRGEFAIVYQHLLCPMLDDRTCVEPDPHPFAGQFVWTRQSNRFGWRSYLGREPGDSGVSYYAAPARAADLTGLPPTYLAVGALDLFLEENLDYGRRLTRAGVACELHVYPGVFHGAAAIPDAQVCKNWEADSQRALARALRAKV